MNIEQQRNFLHTFAPIGAAVLVANGYMNALQKVYVSGEPCSISDGWYLPWRSAPRVNNNCEYGLLLIDCIFLDQKILNNRGAKELSEAVRNVSVKTGTKDYFEFPIWT